jgi:hypothetical protein
MEYTCSLAVHDPAHNTPPIIIVLKLLNQIQIPLYILRLHFNIILLSTYETFYAPALCIYEYSSIFVLQVLPILLSLI